MSLLAILAIWVAASALVAPVIGYFLAGRRERREPADALSLEEQSRPRA